MAKIFIKQHRYCYSLSMQKDNSLFYTRVRIDNTGLVSSEKKPKTLHVSQNNKCFYGTHAMGLHCLMLILFHFSVPNIYLLSLKLDISSSIMIGKSFSSYIALYNYIIAICTDNTSILKNQLVLKSNDIQINAGPKKSSAIKFCLWNLNELAADDFVKVSLT